MGTKTGTGTARAILSDEEVLARRDRNAFDGGFQAGLQCVQETHSELLEALKNLVSLAKGHVADAEDWHDYQHAVRVIAKAEGK